MKTNNVRFEVKAIAIDHYFPEKLVVVVIFSEILNNFQF